MDDMGMALTALGLMELLMKLDELFGGDGTKSLFDKVFEWFEDETGIDLVGDAKDGTLAVATNLKIKNHGTDVSTTTSSINFAAPLNAAGSGDVTVTLDASSVSVCSTPKVGQIIAWNGNCWEPIDSCCDVTFQPPPPDPVNCPPPPEPPQPPPPRPVEPKSASDMVVKGSTNHRTVTIEKKVECNGTVVEKTVVTPVADPINHINNNPDDNVISDTKSGDFDLDNIISLDFAQTILKGAGLIYIVNFLTGAITKSIDVADTAVSGQELLIDDLGTLEEGAQYVVQVPAGAVITVPNSTYPTPLGNKAFTTLPFSSSNPIEFLKFEVSSEPIADDTNKNKVNITTNIKLYFNRSVKYNTGNITLHSTAGNITFNSSNFTAGNPFTINPTNNLALDTEYYLTIAPNALTANGLSFAGISDINTIKFKTDAGPSFSVSNVGTTNLIMDRKVIPNNGGTIRIYDMSDNLIKEFNTADRLVQFKG
jgi:hypothetical protein